MSHSQSSGIHEAADAVDSESEASGTISIAADAPQVEVCVHH